ncbi:MAG: CopG family transcriptional regulator [Ruminococcaceae bacterium]|nr:CopG family transcriptional regulator [Oscillospiraceae bacterium]
MSDQTIKIRKKGDDGYKVISMRIKDGTLQKLDELSQKSNRSRNEILNIILENAIDHVEIN